MKKTLLAIAAGALMATAAQAATVSTTASFGLATTNWQETLMLDLFDGSLGTLNSVTFNYGGTISSDFSLESRDADPATVSANTAGMLTFGGPIASSLSISASQSQGVSAFDGVLDFGGTSGFEVLGVAGSDAGSITLVAGLGSFIGAGQFGIDVEAFGSSNASGAGNLVSIIATQGYAEIEVIYDYSVTPPPSVPEPASLALVGLALAGVAVARRRKA